MGPLSEVKKSIHAPIGDANPLSYWVFNGGGGVGVVEGGGGEEGCTVGMGGMEGLPIEPATGW
jgi:hypothetical protein